MSQQPEFLPNLELSRRFYDEVVRGALDHVAHAAACVGSGSEVLGLDTPRSTDHGWGPRCHIFVDAGDVHAVRDRVERVLPTTFLGWPVSFGWDDVPVQHHVRVSTLERWLRDELAVDPRAGLSSEDWLLLPQQRLLHVTAGDVFHDATGELTEVRAALTWYPDDVWRYMLGCAWRRIAQEEAFVGRTAEVGDELGSRVVIARIVRDVIRLCFLLERRYAPYTKWLGTAFGRLDAASDIHDPLARAVASDRHQDREAGLVVAYEALAGRFNALELMPPIEPSVRPYYGRPFMVLMADRFADACFEAIGERWLRSLPPVGSVDQYVDSTDALYPERARRTRGVYSP